MRLLVILISCLTFTVQAQLVQDTMIVSGMEREYVVYRPANYNIGNPLVIHLHGYGVEAYQQMGYTNMNAVADEYGFLIVYPQAIEMAFNSGIDENPNYPVPDVDDVAFIDALIDQMKIDFDVDLLKVYACGMSNGGMMAYKLACEIPERIAAIASVTGTMSERVFDNCAPSVTMPVLEIHGDNDESIPFNGGFVGLKGIPEVLEYWIDNNHCLAFESYLLPDNNTEDNSVIQVQRYFNCDNNAEVQLYLARNGGHTWPNGGDLVWWDVVTNRDIDGSTEVWNFLKNYSLADRYITYNHEQIDLSANLFNVKIAHKEAEIHFNIPVDVKQINWYNLKGQLIASVFDRMNVTQQKIIFSVPDSIFLQEGIYILQLITEHKRFVQKVNFIK